jgi:hypothetical protein
MLAQRGGPEDEGGWLSIHNSNGPGQVLGRVVRRGSQYSDFGINTGPGESQFCARNNKAAVEREPEP